MLGVCCVVGQPMLRGCPTPPKRGVSRGASSGYMRPPPRPPGGAPGRVPGSVVQVGALDGERTAAYGPAASVPVPSDSVPPPRPAADDVGPERGAAFPLPSSSPPPAGPAVERAGAPSG